MGQQGASFGNKRKFSEEASADPGCLVRSGSCSFAQIPSDSEVQREENSACRHGVPRTRAG